MMFIFLVFVRDRADLLQSFTWATWLLIFPLFENSIIRDCIRRYNKSKFGPFSSTECENCFEFVPVSKMIYRNIVQSVVSPDIFAISKPVKIWMRWVETQRCFGSTD